MSNPRGGGATARLRRTFRYPNDSDSDGGEPDAMDEQGKHPKHPSSFPLSRTPSSYQPTKLELLARG